jgi:hypothetical protein
MKIKLPHFVTCPICIIHLGLALFFIYLIVFTSYKSVGVGCLMTTIIVYLVTLTMGR